MNYFTINTTDIPRFLGTPLKTKYIGYSPASENKSKGYYQSIDLAFILSGDADKAVTKIDGRKYERTIPCMSVCIPEHYYEQLTSGRREVFYISYDASVADFFEKIGINLYDFMKEIQLGSRIPYLINEIFGLVGKIHEHGIIDRIDMLCYDLVMEGAIIVKINKKSISRNEELVRKAASFMEMNYHKNISIRSIALKHNISERTFTRCWKKLFPVSPLAYLIDLKITETQHLLKETALCIHEIATKVNFKDALYFSRIFRKKTGMSPLAYRKYAKEADSDEKDVYL